MLLQFVLALFATAGFSLLFNIPRRHIAMASVVGGAGWVIYQYVLTLDNSVVAACFLASCGVALLSDIFCRFFKEAATVFIIPGILPLVPGAGMYYTMRALLDSDLTKAAQTGTQTLLMAGSIAIGLLVMSSIVRTIVVIKRTLLKQPR